VLKKKSINISTHDINKKEFSDLIIYHDVFDKEELLTLSARKWLILFESVVISPKNWEKKNHDSFDKIFTWNDDLVDNEKYFKINFAHKFPEDKVVYRRVSHDFYNKKLCTLISGNKVANNSFELYSERENTIRWFEKNAIENFDLYGVGWEQSIPKNKYLRFLYARCSFIRKLLGSQYPSYKGAVESKVDVLCRYKFAICYENAKNIPGYITEKIFDCFFSGCVPIYWGAPNITEHIPKNCFIDRRDFSSHEELYAHLKNMEEREYLEIQKNIENYIFSEKADPYRAETFANTIVDNILSDF
jgi:alpha(1,3/1,4) fucosyltransferase